VTGQASSEPSFAHASRPVRGRRSRQHRKPADPVPAEALRRIRPTESRVRRYVATYATSATQGRPDLRAGLLAAKLLDCRRPPRDLAPRVNPIFGRGWTHKELVRLASEARMFMTDGLRARFECSPNWHLRWLPQITA
jgi:hypothetical protein